MQSSQLEIFNGMPFLFWAKDEEGRYIWGNRTINAFAKEDVAGKTEYELPWSANADELRADDKEVLRTGEPIFRHEMRHGRLIRDRIAPLAFQSSAERARLV